MMNKWLPEREDYSIQAMHKLSRIEYPEGMWSTVDRPTIVVYGPMFNQIAEVVYENAALPRD